MQVLELFLSHHGGTKLKSIVAKTKFLTFNLNDGHGT